jgi:hypothetical protein
MLNGISTPNNGKAMVLSFAEKHGHITYAGYSDGWLHTECGVHLAANGKPGHYECLKCGAMFKKQSMLATQTETRDGRAKDLLSTVTLEHRNDKIGLIRFIVRSQSRPKAYIVYRDNHGNWTCPCEDFQKHKKYDDWKCKHVIACEYWLENEEKSKERTEKIRPSLICTGTQAEFETVNSLDEKQIVNGDDRVLAYLINGKVTISFCGTMELATRMGITITDVETRKAYHLSVATAKAHNPKTNITQVGAHSSPKLVNGMPNPQAETIAIGLAKRNAILKVLPEVIVYQFANTHAKFVSKDALDASTVSDNEPVKVSTQKGQKQTHTGEINKSYWAKTVDGQIVAVTETGEKSPVPRCEFYDKGKCKRCLAPHPYLGIGHTHPKVACAGDTESEACKRMQERYPSSFGRTTEREGGNTNVLQAS